MNTIHRLSVRLAVSLLVLGATSSAWAIGLPGGGRQQEEERPPQQEQPAPPRQREAPRPARPPRGDQPNGGGAVNQRERNDNRNGSAFRGDPGNGNRGDFRGDRDDRGRYYDNRRGPPRVMPSLPYGYRQYSWNGGSYYHQGGHWYRPYGSSFISIGAPYGLFVSYLPSYNSSFWYGGSRYFLADDTYYTYEPVRRGYVVARSPYEDDRDDGDDSNAQDDDLFIYPARGQSEKQQSDDRYECHRWAADETRYDPIDADYDAGKRADYLRAMTACLTGRGYSVR